MTRERVEQATDVEVAIARLSGIVEDADDIRGDRWFHNALTTLSNALAESERELEAISENYDRNHALWAQRLVESEKERERLEAELHDAKEELLLGPEAFKAAQFWDKVEQLEEAEKERERLREALLAEHGEMHAYGIAQGVEEGCRICQALSPDSQEKR